jgi:hypothetical protein
LHDACVLYAVVCVLDSHVAPLTLA